MKFFNKSKLILSTIILTLSQILFIMIPWSTSDHPSYLGYFPILMMGISEAIYLAAVFPMIPLIVKHHAQGTAFGINSSFINLGVSLGPLVVGVLTFKSLHENTYFWVNFWLGLFSLVGAIFSVLLWIMDKIYLDR